jgi:L-rhamnose isomerase
MLRQQSYNDAREQYASLGVDTDAALKRLKVIPISLHCWQLDDLSGFENSGRGLSGGISAIGNAPGKPANREEFLAHLDKALSRIPGRNRLALHAVYLDNSGKFVDRDAIDPAHFRFWVDYAKEKKIGLDFNPTYFSHPLADDNFTLASADDKKRAFWVEHGRRCRKIGEYFGKELGTPCITNHWIPDGFKDYTIDKLAPRKRLAESLNEILGESISREYNMDSFESKLFGLGIESDTVGSHEFYSNYCARRDDAMVCMDMGHFHPTETVSAKLTAYIALGQQVMLHVSRPVRWDSDHVVSFDDETREVMLEIARSDAFDTVHIGTDYFDASINRIAATVLGARNVKKAILYALLEPTKLLKELEEKGDLTKRLAYVEEQKSLPFGSVWNMFCEQEGVPSVRWMDEF